MIHFENFNHQSDCFNELMKGAFDKNISKYSTFEILLSKTVGQSCGPLTILNADEDSFDANNLISKIHLFFCKCEIYILMCRLKVSTTKNCFQFSGFIFIVNDDFTSHLK